jgi:hypothetical protein
MQGTYTVTLQVTDVYGISGTSSQTLQCNVVALITSVKVSATQVIAGQTVSFTVNTDGYITSTSVSFSNGGYIVLSPSCTPAGSCLKNTWTGSYRVPMSFKGTLGYTVTATNSGATGGGSITPTTAQYSGTITVRGLIVHL